MTRDEVEELRGDLSLPGRSAVLLFLVSRMDQLPGTGEDFGLEEESNRFADCLTEDLGTGWKPDSKEYAFTCFLAGFSAGRSA